MRCPSCGKGDHTDVIDSRLNLMRDVRRRRYRCRVCISRFTTYESLTPPPARMPASLPVDADTVSSVLARAKSLVNLAAMLYEDEAAKERLRRVLGEAASK